MSADDQRAAVQSAIDRAYIGADVEGDARHLAMQVDRLRAELAETRDRRDYLQGQLDIIYDAEYSLNDTLKRRIEKMGTAGDALADAAEHVLIGYYSARLRSAEQAWRSVRGDAPTQPPAADGPDTELAAAIAYFDEFDPRVALTPRYLVHDALLHAATIVRAYLDRPAVARTDGQDPTAHAHVWRLHRNVTSKGHVLPAYEACWCGAARSVPASATSAAPADDTAAPGPIETAARQLYAAIVAEHQRGETFPMRVSVCTNGLREALGETYPDDAPAAGQPVRGSQGSAS